MRPRREACTHLPWLLEPRKRQTQHSPLDRALRKAATHPSGFRTWGLGFRRRASAALPEAKGVTSLYAKGVSSPSKGVTSLYAREDMGALEVRPVLIRNPTEEGKQCKSLRRARVATSMGSRDPPHSKGLFVLFVCVRTHVIRFF